MDREYIVPSNSKKQGLIFGFMKLPDLIIMCIGILITFLMFSILSVSDIWLALLCLLPTLVAVFLVFPIPNYHNTRFLLNSIIRFYFKDRRKYYWRGWCYKYEQPSDEPEQSKLSFNRW